MSGSLVQGGAAVGRFTDLAPLEQAVVHSLRLWSEGPDGRASLQADWAACHGEATAQTLADRFGELLDCALRHARRPLMCHTPGCPCAGGDESVFARFVALAAGGEREEAVLIATLMVRADLALCLADLAADVGRGMMRAQPVVWVTAAPERHAWRH